MATKTVKETFRRSRDEIHDYILQFCITYGREKAELERGENRRASICGFVHPWGENRPVIGDLVILSSAPRTKWRVGWLREMRELQSGWPEYLIESLEDGALCWWGNVGISWLERDYVRDVWRWSDRQWAFKERWFHVCYKEKSAYMVLPVYPEFGEGYEVTIGTRIRHGLGDALPGRTFPDWRKVTKVMMANFYDQCLAEWEVHLAAVKAARQAEEKLNAG